MEKDEDDENKESEENVEEVEPSKTKFRRVYQKEIRVG